MLFIYLIDFTNGVHGENTGLTNNNQNGSTRDNTKIATEEPTLNVDVSITNGATALGRNKSVRFSDGIAPGKLASNSKSNDIDISLGKYQSFFFKLDFKLKAFLV